MISRLAFLKLIAAGFVGGCSPAPMPVSQSSNDPSNANAPEGVSPLPPTAAPSPPATASSSAAHSQPAHGADAGSTEVVYVCPMHPEATSTKPGEVCPKCNMKLVPKK